MIDITQISDLQCSSADADGMVTIRFYYQGDNYEVHVPVSYDWKTAFNMMQEAVENGT